MKRKNFDIGSNLGAIVHGQETIILDKRAGTFNLDDIEFTYEIKQESIVSSSTSAESGSKGIGTHSISDDGACKLPTLLVYKTIIASDAIRTSLASATKRYKELFEAVQRSDKALERAETACSTNDQTSVADVGALFLENKKLQKELAATVATTELKYEQYSTEILLPPGIFRFLSGTKQPICWCPVVPLCPSLKLIAGSVTAAFDKDSKSFQLTALDASEIIGQHRHILNYILMQNLSNKLTKLLYRGSRDGFTAAAYRSKCNNQSAQLLLCTAVGEDPVFGGFNLSPVDFGSCWGFSISRRGIHDATKFTVPSGREFYSIMTKTSLPKSHAISIGDGDDLKRSSYCNGAVAETRAILSAGPLANSASKKSKKAFVVDQIEVYSINAVI